MKILSYRVFSIVIFVFYSQHELNSLGILNIATVGVFIVTIILISNYRLTL